MAHGLIRHHVEREVGVGISDISAIPEYFPCIVRLGQFAFGVPPPLDEPVSLSLESCQIRAAPDKAAPVQIDDLMVAFTSVVVIPAPDVRVYTRKENLSAGGRALDVGQPEVVPVLVARRKLERVFSVADRVEVQIARVVRVSHAVRGIRVIETHESHRHVIHREPPVLQLLAHIEISIIERNMNKVSCRRRTPAESKRINFNLFNRTGRVQLGNVRHKPIKARSHFRDDPGYPGAERHAFRDVSAVGLCAYALDVIVLPDILHIRILPHLLLAFGNIGRGALIACGAGRKISLKPDVIGRTRPCIHAVVAGAIEKHRGTHPLRRRGRRLVRVASLTNCRVHGLYLNRYRPQPASNPQMCACAPFLVHGTMRLWACRLSGPQAECRKTRRVFFISSPYRYALTRSSSEKPSRRSGIAMWASGVVMPSLQ